MLNLARKLINSPISKENNVFLLTNIGISVKMVDIEYIDSSVFQDRGGIIPHQHCMIFTDFIIWKNHSLRCTNLTDGGFKMKGFVQDFAAADVFACFSSRGQ